VEAQQVAVRYGSVAAAEAEPNDDAHVVFERELAGDPTLRLGGQAHVRDGAPSAQGEVDSDEAAGLAVGGPELLSTRLEPDGGPRRQLGVETGVRWAWRLAASSRSR